eukprot:893858-Prymnesium_polylepis.2
MSCALQSRDDDNCHTRVHKLYQARWLAPRQSGGRAQRRGIPVAGRGAHPGWRSRAPDDESDASDDAPHHAKYPFLSRRGSTAWPVTRSGGFGMLQPKSELVVAGRRGDTLNGSSIRYRGELCIAW